MEHDHKIKYTIGLYINELVYTTVRDCTHIVMKIQCDMGIS